MTQHNTHTHPAHILLLKSVDRSLLQPATRWLSSTTGQTHFESSLDINKAHVTRDIGCARVTHSAWIYSSLFAIEWSSRKKKQHHAGLRLGRIESIWPGVRADLSIMSPKYVERCVCVVLPCVECVVFMKPENMFAQIMGSTRAQDTDCWTLSFDIVRARIWFNFLEFFSAENNAGEDIGLCSTMHAGTRHKCVHIFSLICLWLFYDGFIINWQLHILKVNMYYVDIINIVSIQINSTAMMNYKYFVI